MNTVVADDKVRMELMKLVLQVAYADHQLAPEEATRMRALVSGLQLSLEQRAQVELWMAGQQPLPPPDLGLLALHRAQALRVCAHVAAADGVVTEEERELINQVTDLLQRS